MTKNKFNQAKQQTVISSADRRNNVTLIKAHQLILEDKSKIKEDKSKIKVRLTSTS